MSNDPKIWAAAREAMPLPALMRAIGDGEFVPVAFGGQHKDSQLLCPFCGKRGKFTVLFSGGRHAFKCQSTSCAANNVDGGAGEIGYLGLRKGLSRRAAAEMWLDLALPNREKKEQKTGRQGDEEAGREEVFRNPAHDMEARTPEHALWKKLIWSAADGERETWKRGLGPETLERMGVRSNNPGNKIAVESLALSFPEPVLIEKGILKCKDGKVRAAGQLTGYGRSGWFICECGERFKARRCPKCERKKRDEDAEWLPTVQPPLIPYYDYKDGSIIYLRPHKGGISNRDLKALEKLDIPDEDDPTETCAAHVYVPPDFAELLEACDGTAVFTEGEWKVNALAQCGLAALACPGITFIRNPVFRQELVRILRWFGVRHLAVIFDNEDKGNPAFADRYQPDINKQIDTDVWAEYTLQDLYGEMRSHGGSIRLGRLPDEERIEGKADFDSILGRRVREAQERLGDSETGRRGEGAEASVASVSKSPCLQVSMSALESGTKAARKIFSKAIREAIEDPASQKDLYPGAKRRAIDRRLHLLRHCTRKLKFGDSAERELAKRFAEWDYQDLLQEDKDRKKPAPVDSRMADAFKAVRGCYYIRKPMKEGKQREEIETVIIPGIEGKIMAAKDAKKFDEVRMLYTYRRAYNERLKGPTKTESDCVVKGVFQVHTPAGTVFKVRVYDSRDTRRTHKPPLLTLTSEDMCQPTDMKKWMSLHSHNWEGGVESLDKFRRDLFDQVYLREIHSVTYCGHHEVGMYFAEDGAFMDDKASKEGISIVIRPDENGVLWNPNDGLGYLLDVGEGDGEEEAKRKARFSLGLPRLFSPRRGSGGGAEQEMSAGSFFALGTTGYHTATFICEHFHAPETKKVRDLSLAMQKSEARPSVEDLLAAAGPETIPLPDFTAPQDALTGRPMLTDQTVHRALDTAAARGVFMHLRDDLPKIIGDLDAWMALGVMFGFAIGPALVDYKFCHPGLFGTGDLSSGKSETLRRLPAIYGMPINRSIMLSKTSGVGLTRALTNYSSVPVHADEYRKILGKEKGIDDALRAATERSAGVKGTIASDTSTQSLPPRTSPVCSGQNSPSDAATASRYVHLTFSEKRRQPGSEDAWARFNAETRHFYHLGRWLMMRRAAYEKRTMAELHTWMTDKSILAQIAAGATQGKDRVMVTTGVAFACFVTMAEMLGLPLSPQEKDTFRKFAIAHGARTLTEVSEETFRHQFWNDVITGLKSQPTSAIKPKWFETGRHVTIKFPDGKTFADGKTPKDAKYSTAELRQLLTQENPLRLMVTTTHWHTHAVPVLYVAINEVFAAWEKDLRSKGHEVPISFQNLRSESEREPYFIPPSKVTRDLVHWQTFKLSDDENAAQSSKQACWCLSLERKETGEYLWEYAPAILRALDQMREIEDDPLSP